MLSLIFYERNDYGENEKRSLEISLWMLNEIMFSWFWNIFLKWLILKCQRPF